MDFSDPAQRAVFFDLHRGLAREGPGNRAAVARALALVDALPPGPLVLDLGCGPGGQTTDLAELLPDARITALDLHEPFLRDLECRAGRACVAGRIRTVHGDMARLPFGPASFDLIWCEGAAYILGLPAALAAWRPLLKPGGALALSEPVWLRDDPPEPVRALWAAYEAMGDIAAVRTHARAAGYDPCGDFVLPEEAWWDDYYGPLEARLREIEPRHAADPLARAILDEARAEIDCFRRHADCYGYLFQVLRPRPGAGWP